MENSNFVKAMEKQVAWKLTENGADALNTTFDACLDLFSCVGGLRFRDDSEIEKLVCAAYSENKLVTMKIIFYARDIEEGLGERRAFRVALKYLALRFPKDVLLNLDNIVRFGRYDDLYQLVDTPCEKKMFEYMKKIFTDDLKACDENKPVSLLGKWLKSVNTSSKESNLLGKKTAKAFSMSDKDYRKALSKLRNYIDVVERKMSEKRWDEIDFNKVPGKAMLRYTDCFKKNQPDRFKLYLDALQSGEKIIVDGKEVDAKINTKKLFPYEILEKYAGGMFSLDPLKYNQECEIMWNNLNDWLENAAENTIVIADTSGSMMGRAMATSVGLGIYFAERNKGVFHNKFMTFASKPSWINLVEGSSLSDKISKVPDICDNTNLEAAFDLILQTALNAKLKQEDMPKNLIIITDMEFDDCVIVNSSNYSKRKSESGKKTFYDKMKDMYEKNGYKLPEVTFWNVNARNSTYHTKKDTPFVRMVSGQSPSVFKSLIDGKTHTPYEFMLEVINVERYSTIKVCE